jgi:hypothetical protein
MRIVCLSFFLLSGLASGVQGESRIVCNAEPLGGAAISPIWPAPYISDKGLLCFDVKAWPEYAGQNCVADRGRISWKGTVVVSIDGASQGRDATDFRVVSPVVNRERLEYVIEWKRGSAWRPMQKVAINRLSGEAVSYFVTLHGGESYQCLLERPKL